MRHTVLAVVACLVAVSGCVSSPTQGEAPGTDRTCFRVRLVNSFSALDDHHVVVKVSANKRFLLTLEKSCSGLAFSRGITIADESTRVCDDGFAWLSFEHPGSGTERCRIVDVEAVNSSEEAEALVDSRKDD